MFLFARREFLGLHFGDFIRIVEFLDKSFDIDVSVLEVFMMRIYDGGFAIVPEKKPREIAIVAG
jgi:hypothetical protein